MSQNRPALQARSILSKHWNGRLPVEPGRIARDLGLTLVPRGVGTDQYGFSGGFRRADSVIEYHAGEPAVRQRFTVAHELGHFALGHPDAPRDTPDMFRASNGTGIEREANQFAAELLMPADELQALVQSGKMSTVEQLSKAFGVSQVAMTWRLKNLGLV